jgi:dienelactone hydrolase
MADSEGIPPWKMPFPDLDHEMLQECWWESVRCDAAYEEDVQVFVVPPQGVGRGVPETPSPVILYLSGNGHIDDRELFLEGGVDLLMRNSAARQCYLVAPKPTTRSGIVAYGPRTEGWRRRWSPDAVWAAFTTVLRRCGAERMDPGRLYATGVSLGAGGVWQLAINYGEYLAGIVPISGALEWPEDAWPRGSGPTEEVRKRLDMVPLRAYQIASDKRAGDPIWDVEWLTWGLQEERADYTLPGVEEGTEIIVAHRRWLRRPRDAYAPYCAGAAANTTPTPMELYVAPTRLQDWSYWNSRGGDNHCLWYRVYTFESWDLVGFFLRHSVPHERQWRFDSAPLQVDTTLERAQIEAEWRAAKETW